MQEKITLVEQGLRFDMKLKLAGSRLARKIGTGVRDCTKSDRFLGHLEDLVKNHAEKNPKGDDYFLPPPGKTERIEESVNHFVLTQLGTTSKPRARQTAFLLTTLSASGKKTFPT